MIKKTGAAFESFTQVHTAWFLGIALVTWRPTELYSPSAA
jgi:hypothetical protein